MIKNLVNLSIMMNCKNYRFFNTFITPPIERYLIKAKDAHRVISNKLLDPELSPQEMANFGRKFCEYEDLVIAYQNWMTTRELLFRTKKLGEEEKDPMMITLINNELGEQEKNLNLIEAKIKSLLVSNNPEDHGDAVMEIRAGTGGEEATLFAGEMLKMYQKFALLNSWSFEIINKSEDGGDGVREVSINLSGENVFGILKYESGVHRVQRVPKTENSGRIHTSTVTVAILPKSEEIKIDIPEKDLRFDSFKSSGPGGQHVNKTNSAVRVVHLPTGIAVAVQEGRCAQQNRIRALDILQAKLHSIKLSEQEESRSKSRKSQIGSAERSEKIRTYNFQQDRITDHRIGHCIHGIDVFLEGKSLMEFVNLLKGKDEESHLESIISNEQS